VINNKLEKCLHKNYATTTKLKRWKMHWMAEKGANF